MRNLKLETDRQRPYSPAMLMFVTLTFLAIATGCGSDETNGDELSSELRTSTSGSATTSAASLSEVTSITASETSPTVGSESTSPTTVISSSTSAASSLLSNTTAQQNVTTTMPQTLTPKNAETVRIRFESKVSDVSAKELETAALKTLNDKRGWSKAGFTFVADDTGPYRVVLAEGPAVDQLCLPLKTYSKVSCQNGPVVALNADRWRTGVAHWKSSNWQATIATYRGYLINHEVGHLIGQRHPTSRCPINGRPAGVMEQQTKSLEGCEGNPWPRDWEIAYAKSRPVVYAPLPAWAPEPRPTNNER